MKDKIINENIILEKFSAQNLIHLEVAKKFQKDPVIQKFFSEWEQITYLSIDDDSNTYYSFVIFDNKPIGICTITFNNDEICTFSQGYLEEYRGHGYSKIIRDIIKEELFSQGVRVIKGYIKKDNLSSIKSAAKTGMNLIEVPGTGLLEIQYFSNRKR